MKIINILHNVSNWISYNILRNKKGKFIISDKYELIYKDDFKDESLFNDRYIRKQNWGDYHPNDMYQWYDPKAIDINENLKLSITQNTKNVDGVTIPYGVGLAASKEYFGYGIFEWNILLPQGVGLWPAIWLSSSNSWPPEIDVIEGYSDKYGKYGVNLNTNFHCGENNESHYHTGANRHGSFIDTDKCINLICDWTKDYIKIYYNGFLCRTLKNEKDLAWFNGKKMQVIMNMALRPEIIKGRYFGSIAKSPLIVYDFKFYSIKIQ